MTTNNFRPIRRLLFALLLMPAMILAQGNNTAAPSSIFERLTTVEGAKMTLEADLTTIIEQKKTNQYFPATLTTDNGQTYKIEVKPRGRFRRKVSAFPPLKLKFKKKDIVAQGLDTLNEIKLVLPCYETDQGNDLIVREYLAYRMYEQLTSVSMRARLIRLTIRDTHVEKSKKPMYAILLEDEEELEKRLGAKLNEEYGTPTDSLHTNQMALMVMFQYMIGNTDWEVAMLRNVRLLRSMNSNKLFPVPYDFDFSGLVSAPYSSPNSDTGLKTVRDRFLMNNGLRPEALKRALSQLKNAKNNLYSLCDSKYLSPNATDDMKGFLQTFFDKVDGKEEIPQLIKLQSD